MKMNRYHSNRTWTDRHPLYRGVSVCPKELSNLDKCNSQTLFRKRRLLSGLVRDLSVVGQTTFVRNSFVHSKTFKKKTLKNENNF